MYSQVKLCTIMKRQYHDQEMQQLARLKAMGSSHRTDVQKNYDSRIQQKQKAKLQASREKKALEKAVDRQLKGLEGVEREERRRELMDSHFDLSASTLTESDRKQAAKAKKDVDRAEKLRKKREMISSGLLSPSASTTKVQSAINASLTLSHGSDTMREGEEEFRKMVSFREETSKSLDEFDIPEPLPLPGPVQGAGLERTLVPPLQLQTRSMSMSNSQIQSPIVGDDVGSPLSNNTFDEEEDGVEPNHVASKSILSFPSWRKTKKK